jgi:hypothetical protein
MGMEDILSYVERLEEHWNRGEMIDVVIFSPGYAIKEIQAF